MNLDIRTTPFSMRGSYIALSQLEGRGNRHGLYVRSINGASFLAGSTATGAVARIEPLHNGQEIAFKAEMSPEELRLVTGKGVIRFAFADAESLLVRGEGRGLGLRLRMDDGGYIHALPREGRKCAMLNCGGVHCRFVVAPLEGGCAFHQDWNGSWSKNAYVELSPEEATGCFQADIGEVIYEWKGLPKETDYALCRDMRAREFAKFAGSMPGAPEVFSETRKETAYVMWSCTVAPRGILRREGMLMSKNWMCNVWSWDHCFNAMALSENLPSEAWDQFMLLFDHQDECGALPDYINNTFCETRYCKPPIHGWALAYMMERMELTDAQASEAYDRLSRWTNWWTTCRDTDGDGICEYFHNNDSGQDNSTAFRDGRMMELPDLAAFLILQMETLEKLAARLGRREEAASWKRRGEEMLCAMLAHCFRDGAPVATVSYDHDVISCDALILLLPIVIGNRLPEGSRKWIVERLQTRHLTEHGLATEAPDSPLYVPDGYWRGPIWAPTTMLFVDALHRIGEVELAREIARKYCEMVRQSGSAENFDALTGEGLRDRAYTWSASVFLTLASYLVQTERS